MNNCHIIKLNTKPYDTSDNDRIRDQVIEVAARHLLNKVHPHIVRQALYAAAMTFDKSVTNHEDDDSDIPW